MRVAVYYSNDDLRIEERPIPAISDSEILVKMMASGICGTDVMQWYRQKKGPRVLGHEMAGEIAKVGGGVKGFRKGERVFVSHHVPCYRCHHCAEGNFTACESLHAGNYEPGGFSEYIRIPEQNVKFGTFPLPEKITYEEGAMIEPLACAVLGHKNLDLRDNHTVLIIGSGISGLLHISLAKMKGCTIIATDVNDYRLQMAREFGADYVFRADAYSTDELKKITGGRLAQRVIVCAGASQAVDSALSSVERSGRILFFAVPQRDINIPSLRFWRDEISVSFSYGAAPDDLRKAIELIDAGKIPAAKMVTHKIPLSEIQKGFKLVAEAKESLKVVIVPDGSA